MPQSAVRWSTPPDRLTTVRLKALRPPSFLARCSASRSSRMTAVSGAWWWATTAPQLAVAPPIMRIRCPRRLPLPGFRPDRGGRRAKPSLQTSLRLARAAFQSIDASRGSWPLYAQRSRCIAGSRSATGSIAITSSPPAYSTRPRYSCSITSGTTCNAKSLSAPEIARWRLGEIARVCPPYSLSAGFSRARASNPSRTCGWKLSR